MSTRIAFLSLCSAIAAGPALAQSVQTVKIGHVTPLSGGLAHYGKDTRNAATMAVDDLNAKRLVIGGKRIEFKLEVEDDAADPRQGTAAAQKMCDSNVAGVVGHINSGTAIPAARIYNECEIPFITSGATNPKLTQMGYKTTFRILASDDALGAGVANYTAKELKLKRVAVIDDRTAYGQGVANVFKSAAKSAGIEIVAEEFTSDKATDFSAILTNIKSKKVDALFFAGADGQAGPMLRQMTQLGMEKVRMLGGDGVCTTQLAELSGNSAALSGVVCAEGGASLAKMPGGPAWKKRYDERFPKDYVLFSPYTYDGIMVLADAMQRADSVDPKRYLPKLFDTNYEGVTTKVRFDNQGDLKNAAITLYSYKGGVKTPLD
ncbi:MAG: branched-chain amino acid ABC transporter substrate-binding protein [Proteobacteria bacterium]|nr:branched-chain amino acid ABC transporter substrate-binding protein [Pseudomonadota bacterium]